jgi:hypothetical protein
VTATIAPGVPINEPDEEFDEEFAEVIEEVAQRLPDPTKGNGGGSGKVEIDAGDQDLPAVTKKAWAAVVEGNHPERLFRFGGDPVRIEADDEGSLFLRPLDADRLRGEVARAATWVRHVKEKFGSYKKPAHPPMPVIRDMLAQPELPLPVLSAVISVPAFGPDGSLHDTPGYNAGTRLFYAPPVDFRVPRVSEAPNRAELEFALTVVEDLIGDFPFTGPSEHAHAIGLFLLPFVRNLIAGPTPLHLVEKPSPGTGASLLVDAIFFPVLGRSVSSMAEGRDEDEWRKRLTALLRSGALVALFDNLRGKLDSASVSAAITAVTWEDRKLGSSDTLRLPVRCVWTATGNNPSLSSEISRRVVRIRLDAKVDRPWQRPTSEFRHPDLRAWAAENRHDLVWAALTLVRAWLAAGQPAPPELPTLGMFEAWSRVIGGILFHAGIEGFLTNLDEFYDSSDSEGTDVRAFLSVWWERHLEDPVGVGSLFEIASSADSLLPLGDKGDRSQRIRLGKLLGQLRDRRYQLREGLTVCIVSAGVVHKSGQWRLRRV